VSVVSHRGAAAAAPENTLAGIAAGLEYGAPFIEIDVQRTKDGVIVLMHDKTVDRTTDGTGSVGELDYEYLRRLDAGSYFGVEFTSEGVPALDAALSAIKERPATLVIEVKQPGKYPGIASDIAGLIKMHGAQDRVIVISFDVAWVREFRSLAPGVTLGALYIYPFLSPPREVEFVNIFWPSIVLDPTLVWRMKKRGNKVWAWNIDNKMIADFLVWAGVDGITLDRPWLLDGG